MRFYLILICFVIFIISCNTPSSTTSIETITEDTIIPQGIQRGTINVLSAVIDESCNYALYIPSDSLKKYPLIVIFDPHAAGNHAASQYKDLANKYKVVLAASNNIQNNMEAERFTYFANCIIDDVMHNTPIDSAHVYLMGFSGGARVASYIAQQENLFKGLIGCGAGINDLLNVKTTNFLYVGMAGFSDFNFLELYKSETTFRQSYIKTLFKYFEGKHEWPPDSIMEYAFVAISIDSKNESQNNNEKTYFQNEINKSKKIPIRDIWKKALEYRALKDLFNNTHEFQHEKEQVNNYLNGYEAKSSERTINLSLNSETKSQADIQKSIVDKDLEWWKKKITLLISASNKINKTPADYRDIRLLNYISMLCYSATNQTLKNGDMLNAAKYLKIYKLADFQNPDVPFLSAVYFAINKKYNIAIDSLESAIQLGFSDKNKWRNEHSFFPLKDSIRFIDLESKLNSMP